MSYLANMTQQQREEALIKAKAAKEAKVAAWKFNAHNLKSDFADESYWRKLASKYGVRMPSSYVPGGELRLTRRAMRKLGLTQDDVRDAFGGDLKFVHESNPTWPAYAIIGLLLEMRDEK